MKQVKALVQITCLLALIQSCGDAVAPIPPLKGRTVIACLAGNNNLSDEAYENINQMEAAIGDVDGHLIVYARLKNIAPALYKIIPDHSEQIRSQKIKSYLAHDSSDPAVMHQVIAEIKAAYPAQSYGLILWSHASGWIPTGYEGIKLKSFGDDNGSTMDIKQLRHALPDDLDFILFDACYMASVEVLYEIREKAKYFIASLGEVLANGKPYSEMTNDLFLPTADASLRIAQKYHAHYNSKSGFYRSATVSVINARELLTMPDISRRLLHSHTSPYADLRRNTVQRMDFERYGNALIASDFKDFMQQNFGSSLT